MGLSIAELNKTLERYDAILQTEMKRKEALEQDLEVTKQRLGHLAYVFYTASKQKEMLLQDETRKGEGKNEV